MKDSNNTIRWVNVNNKVILIIGDNWKGSPIIACHADLLLISKETKERFKHCFIGEAKNIETIFI